MGSKKEFTTFELIFHGKEPELNDFSNEFSNLQWVSKNIRRLGPDEAVYAGGAPAELIILVVSLTANIFTIANILAKRLARKQDSIIHIGNKEIQLKGVWKPKEIANILNVISRKTSREEALKQISEIKSNIYIFNHGLTSVIMQEVIIGNEVHSILGVQARGFRQGNRKIQASNGRERKRV